MKSLQHTKLDIPILTETKQKGSDIEEIRHVMYIYTGDSKISQPCKGVSTEIDKIRKNRLVN